jgi:hypothetical protein
MEKQEHLAFLQLPQLQIVVLAVVAGITQTRLVLAALAS